MPLNKTIDLILIHPKNPNSKSLVVVYLHKISILSKFIITHLQSNIFLENLYYQTNFLATDVENVITLNLLILYKL